MARLVVITVVVCATIAILFHYRFRVTPDELRARISHELPLGSSVEQIETFLESIGADHDGPSTSRGDGHFPPGEMRMLNAIVRGLRKGNLLADGVILKFRLDSLDKLVDFKVYYRFTGL